MRTRRSGEEGEDRYEEELGGGETTTRPEQPAAARCPARMRDAFWTNPGPCQANRCPRIDSFLLPTSSLIPPSSSSLSPSPEHP